MHSATQIVLLPTYNTGPRLSGVVAEVLQHWPDVMVIVDGSTDGSERAVLELARRQPRLRVHLQSRNRGKGAAVLEGARLAVAAGFTHGLVMDADGQHPAASIAEFMAMSSANPDAMILGKPIFGPEVPRERLHGRKLSVGMVYLESLGRGIADPLFGFRIYPLASLLATLGPRRGGRRYDFDTESALRMLWAGVRPINLAAPVRYFTREQGGVSHFHYGRDNARLVWMHTRLMTELILWRWPGVLRQRQRWRAAGLRFDHTVELALEPAN